MSTAIASKGRIVVGTDGSERANRAVEWAAGRAVARNLPLLVVHVIPEIPQAGAVSRKTIDDYQALMKKQGQERVDELLADLRSAFPQLDLSIEVVVGHPSYVLAQASKDAELVVVGARGESAPLRVRMLGGISDAVTAHAHGPVAVIPDEAHENPDGPVVLGVDVSPSSLKAAKEAFQAAEVRNVPIEAIYGFYAGPVGSAALEDDFAKNLERTVREVLSDEMAQRPDVQVNVRVVPGKPADALVAASKDAGLVIVGSRGRGGFTGLLLGSTSKHVLREAHCPVIVARG